MMHYFIQLLYQLQIKVLLVFSPVTLFHKLSRLSWYSETLYEWLGAHIGNDRLRVLDVGCASGYLSEHLYQLGHDAFGIDASRSMIKSAKNRMPEIDFRQGDACNLPFADNSFDLVLSASLINIIPEPSALVDQMFRVCKPGGRVTLLFPVSGFDNDDLQDTITSLGISGFSRAALITWHKTAPKTAADEVISLLEKHRFHLGEIRHYLSGMIVSVSARKVFVTNAGI